jgi:hypothetical protein
VSGAALNANFASSSSRVYLAWRAASAAGTCTADATGGLVVGGADVQSASPTFVVPESFVGYTVMVCGTNSFGVASSTPVAAYAGVLPSQPGGSSYRVQQNPDNPSDGVYVYPIQDAPSVPAPADPDFQTVYTLAGVESLSFALSESTNPNPVGVKYCAISAPTFCTSVTPISALSANTIATVTFPKSSDFVGDCIPSASVSEGLIQITPGATGRNLDFEINDGHGFVPDRVRFSVDWSNHLQDVQSDWIDIC